MATKKTTTIETAQAAFEAAKAHEADCSAAKAAAQQAEQEERDLLRGAHLPQLQTLLRSAETRLALMKAEDARKEAEAALRDALDAQEAAPALNALEGELRNYVDRIEALRAEIKTLERDAASRIESARQAHRDLAARRRESGRPAPRRFPGHYTTINEVFTPQVVLAAMAEPVPPVQTNGARMHLEHEVYELRIRCELEAREQEAAEKRRRLDAANKAHAEGQRKNEQAARQQTHEQEAKARDDIERAWLKRQAAVRNADGVMHVSAAIVNHDARRSNDGI